MSRTKMKMAIGASAAIIFATVTTVVVIEKIASPSMDESFWLNSQYRSFNNFTGNFVTNVPQIVLIRPTKFPNTNFMTVGGEKFIGINASMAGILYDAYSVGTGLVRTEFPSNLPKGNFDYLANLPVGSKKAFQEELKKKFGITARHETRIRDALLLKVKETNAPGLKISKKYVPPHMESGKYFIYDTSIPMLVFFLEQKFNQPVIDQTGLTNHYDMELPWDNINPATEPEQLKQAILKQLGLELVPSREPIEMLIIERTNN